MRINAISVKNFKVLREIKIENIPNMAVFLGMNGAGKSTLFDVFGFLHDCLAGNVRTALSKRGGFKEVRSREQEGAIEIEIKFKAVENEPLVTYILQIDLNEFNEPVVYREILRFRRGRNGSPWHMLDFSNGTGFAIAGEPESFKSVQNADRDEQKLDSPDILAIKGLGQFKKFKAVSAFRRFIEDWHVSDFHIEEARMTKDAGYSEQLSTTGDNLSLVARYMFENHREKFNGILEKMSKRVPGVQKVEAKETEDGRIILRFQDGKFKDPFAARFVSDGTIKMFAYMILLNDPKHHTLLCIEEPENQLYPKLLRELAEEFRQYAESGGQVFVSTHSPDFLNAVDLNEIYCLVKKDGFTSIKRAKEVELIKDLFDAGDLPGSLWNQGFFEEVFEE